MHATKVKVEHVENRIFVHCTYCLQTMNGKTGFQHLTSLQEINARPSLDILTEYQKWVDEQSNLSDASWVCIQLHKVDTSPENADVEDGKKKSASLHESTVWQSWKYYYVRGLHQNNFQTTPFSLAHYLHTCVCVSLYAVYVRVYVHIVL